MCIKLVIVKKLKKSPFNQVQELMIVEPNFHALHCFTQWCLSFKLNDNAHTGLLKGSDIFSFYAK